MTTTPPPIPTPTELAGRFPDDYQAGQVEARDALEAGVALSEAEVMDRYDLAAVEATAAECPDPDRHLRVAARWLGYGQHLSAALRDRARRGDLPPGPDRS